MHVSCCVNACQLLPANALLAGNIRKAGKLKINSEDLKLSRGVSSSVIEAFCHRVQPLCQRRKTKVQLLLKENI